MTIMISDLLILAGLMVGGGLVLCHQLRIPFSQGTPAQPVSDNQAATERIRQRVQARLRREEERQRPQEGRN